MNTLLSAIFKTTFTRSVLKQSTVHYNQEYYQPMQYCKKKKTTIYCNYKIQLGRII